MGKRARAAVLVSTLVWGWACQQVDRKVLETEREAANAAAEDAGGAPPVPVAATGETPPDVQSLDPGAVGDQSGLTPGLCTDDAGACTAVDAGPVTPACVPTGPRDCSSELDNNCDGLPDNTPDDVCVCVPGATESCDEHPGFDGLGLCTAGVRTCILVGDGGVATGWGACEGAVGPGEQDSCTVAGDDTDCDGAPNSGCTCVDGQTQQCGTSTDIGVCAFGTSTCVNGAFGQCVGAVAPAARDTCAPNDDSNCNGIPNEGCLCLNGDTQACGQDVGNCQPGTRTCANGSFGQCVGTVGAGPRDCTSPQDNDCDGRPDNTIDNVCTCVIGSSRACGTHPQDGVGTCRAGSQQCQAGQGNTSSSFGGCTGSVGPAQQDSCTIPGDDSNCNGSLNDNCIQPLGLGEPCENAEQCDSRSCEAFYVDEDRDGYSPSLAGMQRLCSDAGFLPERTTRRQPTNNSTTDCADTSNLANPEQDQFFSAPILGRAATDPLPYDYNCDGEEESIFQSDTERSIAPGGAPTCTFAPTDLCNGGRIQFTAAPCGQTAFVETCGPSQPQPSFPGLGCFSTDIAEATIFCR